jgi:hypothetical protein
MLLLRTSTNILLSGLGEEHANVHNQMILKKDLKITEKHGRTGFLLLTARRMTFVATFEAFTAVIL